MRTVESRWLEFEAAAIPPGAHAMQRLAMRQAFYEGFISLLGAMREMAEESGDDDDAGSEMVETLHQETRAWFRTLPELYAKVQKEEP